MVNLRNKMRSTFAGKSFAPPRRAYPKGSGTAAVMFLFGIVLGICLNSGLTGGPPEVQTVAVPGPTVTVTVTKDRSVATLPLDCKVALDMITYLEPYLATIQSVGGTEDDILSAARVAIGNKDFIGLNQANDDQNKLMNTQSDARRQVNDTLTELDGAMMRCRAALK